MEVARRGLVYFLVGAAVAAFVRVDWSTPREWGEGVAPEGSEGLPAGVEVRALVHPSAGFEGPLLPEPPAPPTVNVFGENVALELRVWTACWAWGCFDSFGRPDDLDRVEGNGPLYVEFPVLGWEFAAITEPVGLECGRLQNETLALLTPTVHELVPQGYAGEYYVDLFGHGPGGDVFASFVWETTVEGKLEEPQAFASILADHDGEVDSYGVSVWVHGLASAPEEAAATVTVSAADGSSTDMSLTDRPYLCDRGEGRVGGGRLHLEGSNEDGLRAAALGNPPFTYDVELTLDGSVHEAVAVWPDDESESCHPCVPLSFQPALPALAPGGVARE